MSKVVNILVEGPSERDFVTNCLNPYFYEKGIHSVRPIGIETKPGFKGGDVRYNARYKSNVQRILRGREDMIVTSLIDYYRLSNDFPKYRESKSIDDAVARVDFLEDAIAEDVGDERFMPYIQLHEYEGLLFTNIEGFEAIDGITKRNLKQLKRIIDDHPNPELINDGDLTAPSKRLENLIPDYKILGKPFYGTYIALENGLSSILEKCPRFRNWTETLIKSAI